jgi:dienelactone hydrolase
VKKIDLNLFTRWSFPQQGGGHVVFSIGRETDPGVIVMHELPGMSPDCMDFALRLSEQGFRVHLPLLFGEPLDDRFLKHGRALCVSKEFASLKAGVSAPITDWLRALARHLAPEDSGVRVGAIGMCLTGAFVIPMIIEPGVQAGVISQPAIPLSLSHWLLGLGDGSWKRELNVSDEHLAAAARCARDRGKAVLLQRIDGDRLSPPERQHRLADAFGAQAENLEPYPNPNIFRRLFNPPHALLTKEYSDHLEDPNHMTKAAFLKVVSFLQSHLK